MGLKVTNNAFGTLNAGITDSDTTIALQAGEGARFPSLGAGDYFYATLIDTTNNLEIVKVTARSTDTMTVVRGQDSTTARAFSTNDRFELRPVAALFNELTNAVADGDKGDITLSSAGTVWTIDNGAIVEAKIADGAVTAGKLASTLDLTGKTVTLANSVTDLSYVQPVTVGYQSFADNTEYNLAQISIPSPGIWFIWTHLRWGFNNSSQFTRIRVDGTGSSGVTWKMQVERIGTSTPNSNISLTSNWVIDVGSGNSFPYTLNLYGYKSGTGTLFLQNDSNGYNAFGAMRIAKTTNTSSGYVQRGY